MCVELLAMTNAPRFLVAALAASLCLNLLACNADDGLFDKDATYEPMSGTWTYEEEAVLSNTCNDQVGTPDPLTTFTLDYDSGDEFQIELGADDALCEIDGTEFTCAEYDLGSFQVPTFDAILNYSVKWNGEFTSDSVADGREIVGVTCMGEDCTMIDTVPCIRESTWTAEFLQ
jgi:hypothetical protein